MELIASFQIDHLRLLPGIYVSRVDTFADTVLTTFDIRLRAPNREPVCDQPVMHTLEHLGATFLRADKAWGKKVVYVGPMGCRTGCYIIFEGKHTPQDILPLIKEMLDFIIAFEGPIPGAQPAECGNYLEHNLDRTKWECRRYKDILKNATDANFKYPA
ncbi:S-ribosylhomocysteine lyase [Breznakiellaceae bacterium SP9]